MDPYDRPVTGLDSAKRSATPEGLRQDWLLRAGSLTLVSRRASPTGPLFLIPSVRDGLPIRTHSHFYLHRDETHGALSKAAGR